MTQPDDDDGATTGSADGDGHEDDDFTYEPHAEGAGAAYRSTLVITWDEPDEE